LLRALASFSHRLAGQCSALWSNRPIARFIGATGGVLLEIELKFSSFLPMKMCADEFESRGDNGNQRVPSPRDFSFSFAAVRIHWWR
jgi:hypothetical protein